MYQTLLSRILYSKTAINSTTLELTQLMDLLFNGIRIITNKNFKISAKLGLEPNLSAHEADVLTYTPSRIINYNRV